MDDGPIEEAEFGGSTRLFKISETDLADLERMLPELLETVTHMPKCPPRYRVMFRKVQEIVVNVRWNYGPHTDVERIPASD